jgi:hypothetical protein
MFVAARHLLAFAARHRKGANNFVPHLQRCVEMRSALRSGRKAVSKGDNGANKLMSTRVSTESCKVDAPRNVHRHGLLLLNIFMTAVDMEIASAQTGQL